MDNYIIKRQAENIIGGRNVSEGYDRGCGIKYGNIIECVQKDSDFISCMKIMDNRSIMQYERLINLFLIIKFYLPALIEKNKESSERFAIMEFGSYRGGSALFMAQLCKLLKLPVDVYGLDTFEGMPNTDGTLDAHKKGDFQDVDIRELNAYKEKNTLDNLYFVKGLFEETAVETLDNCGKLLLVHIDCDIYTAVKYAYDVTQEYMIPGGYFIFDDATESTCIGATYAVEESVIRRDGRNSEQIYPHFVFRNLD